jgi:exopolysaccharide biosynthesis predicted pyruvyltransferase EpsI
VNLSNHRSAEVEIFSDYIRSIPTHPTSYRHSENSRNELSVIQTMYKLQGKEIFYVPNPGNVGDYVIEEATLQVLNSFNVRQRELLSPEDSKNHIVLIGGGGGLVPLYRYNDEYFSSIAKCNPTQIIILPSTIRGNPNLLMHLREQDVLFLRDQISFNEIASTSRNFQFGLDHDMAFFLDPSPFLDRNTIQNFENHFARELSQLQFVRKPDSVPGLFLRQDKESKLKVLQNITTDISSFYVFQATKEERTVYLFNFILEISRSKRIITDRLHVAIVGDLLEKEITLIDNSYSKNRDVYNQSMSKRKNIRFVSSIEELENFEMFNRGDELTQQRDELTQQRDELTQQRD